MYTPSDYLFIYFCPTPLAFSPAAHMRTQLLSIYHDVLRTRLGCRVAKSLLACRRMDVEKFARCIRAQLWVNDSSKFLCTQNRTPSHREHAVFLEKLSCSLPRESSAKNWASILSATIQFNARYQVEPRRLYFSNESWENAAKCRKTHQIAFGMQFRTKIAVSSWISTRNWALTVIVKFAGNA